MARLIIGHTTHRSALLWVRGDERYPFAFVEVSDGQSAPKRRTVKLESRHFFTGAATLSVLQSETEYTCCVRFGATADTPELRRVDFGDCTGQFTTFPAAPQGSERVRFLLGSCNLHSVGGFSEPDRTFGNLIDVTQRMNVDYMIHCGDQIYYDIPNPLRPPSIDAYRKKYLDAWSDSRLTRRFLTQCPQYMMLDDHEIINDYAVDDKPWTARGLQREYAEYSLRVYREFQHLRHPHPYENQALYYYFNHGEIQTFVMDTRSERVSKGATPEMIGRDQMRRVKSWLKRHRDAVKFVVTSVPIVGEPRNSDDKWNSENYRSQREELFSHILSNEIGGITFLTGDMHTSYHATLNLEGNDKQVVVHELMSSPLNQLQKGKFSDYGADRKTARDGKFRYESSMDRDEFFSDHSNAMLVSVRNRRIDWEIFRTKKPYRELEDDDRCRGSYRV